MLRQVVLAAILSDKMNKPEKYIATVKEIRQESPNVKIIKTFLDRPMEFLPGQFVMFDIDGLSDKKGNPIKKAYSIVSQPGTDHEFCVKIEDYESFTREQINKWDIGQKFNIQGPFGNFVLTDSESFTFIAAGTGIAPFISMLRYLENKNKEITLFYSVKDKKSLLYKDELNSYSINYFVSLTQEETNGYMHGRITRHFLEDNIDIKSDFYICGPAEFTKEMRNYLLDLKIPKEKIHVELWG